jgi:Ca-activated chloride channel family protein
LLLVPLWIFLLTGCGGGGAAETLTVLAGSELRDIEPLLENIRRETGVQLELSYIGTLDGAEKLMAGEPVDLAWFSHAKYLTLLQGAAGRVAAQEKIMLSPVVLGVKESKAREWGWLDNDTLTWRDIADKASSGELRYAMTNPAASNSGFTALVGVASALSASSDALRVEDIDADALAAFFKGQALTAGSSGWLAESYVREQDRLNGMVNYESVLLRLDQGRELEEPLVLVYPREGIITADYPLMLINPDKRAAYDSLVTYLRSPDFQEKVMEETLRRPVIPQVPLGKAFPKQLLVELPFPNSQEVIDALLFSYLDEQRVPAHAVFVLDVSGSMEGEGIGQLTAALKNLTGLDQSLTGQFARFRGRERVTLMPFSDRVQAVANFNVDTTDSSGESMVQIRRYVDSLEASGGTAIYSSLQSAYELVDQAQRQDPDRYYSILLMSDGKSNEGISQDRFGSFYGSLPEDLQRVPTFTVAFGRADEAELAEIAEITGGRLFDAKQESLSQIFKQIRGYQ